MTISKKQFERIKDMAERLKNDVDSLYEKLNNITLEEPRANPGHYEKDRGYSAKHPLTTPPPSGGSGVPVVEDQAENLRKAVKEKDHPLLERLSEYSPGTGRPPFDTAPNNYCKDN